MKKSQLRDAIADVLDLQESGNYIFDSELNRRWAVISKVFRDYLAITEPMPTISEFQKTVWSNKIDKCFYCDGYHGGLSCTSLSVTSTCNINITKPLPTMADQAIAIGFKHDPHPQFMAEGAPADIKI